MAQRPRPPRVLMRDIDSDASQTACAASRASMRQLVKATHHERKGTRDGMDRSHRAPSRRRLTLIDLVIEAAAKSGT